MAPALLAAAVVIAEPAWLAPGDGSAGEFVPAFHEKFSVGAAEQSVGSKCVPVIAFDDAPVRRFRIAQIHDVDCATSRNCLPLVREHLNEQPRRSLTVRTRRVRTYVAHDAVHYECTPLDSVPQVHWLGDEHRKLIVGVRYAEKIGSVTKDEPCELLTTHSRFHEDWPAFTAGSCRAHRASLDLGIEQERAERLGVIDINRHRVESRQRREDRIQTTDDRFIGIEHHVIDLLEGANFPTSLVQCPVGVKAAFVHRNTAAKLHMSDHVTERRTTTVQSVEQICATTQTRGCRYST